MGYSRINNANEKHEEFSKLDKVDISSIKSDDDKRVVLCPIDVIRFHRDNKEHNDASNNDSNTMIFPKSIVKNVVSSQKRKKEESLSLLNMLNWVANAARNPHDVAIGRIPNSSKWKKCKSNEVWKQVLLVKDTIFANRNVATTNKVYGSQMQKKRHMMHPSMYEDDKAPVHLSSKRNYLQRVKSVKSCSCPSCNSCSSSSNKRQKPDIKKSLQIAKTIEVQDDMCKDQETEIYAIGAEVPEWTGVNSESDPKWLGTPMWPPPEGDNEKHDHVVIGKGRQSSCRCLFPGSYNCVRFHISKNRMRLKHMLGPLFYKWKFNRMGEEASCSSWSLEEETEFKSLVIKARQELTHENKSRHEIMNNFWRRAAESIPSKTKDVLVSYYFNVYVLRRRSYQNRIMPEYIDSDDDEQEVGYEKIHALSVTCSKNSQ